MADSPSPRLPRILAPLAIRRFRLLWSGLAVSLLGDGIYLVAISWQVYELSDAPTAFGARTAFLLDSASFVASIFFIGPVYVLLPLVVEQSLHGTARDLGFAFAAGGVGAMLASFVLAGRGLPRRPLTAMYACRAAMCLQLVGYVVARSLWVVVVAAVLRIRAVEERPVPGLAPA